MKITVQVDTEQAPDQVSTNATTTGDAGAANGGGPSNDLLRAMQPGAGGSSSDTASGTGTADAQDAGGPPDSLLQGVREQSLVEPGGHGPARTTSSSGNVTAGVGDAQDGGGAPDLQ